MNSGGAATNWSDYKDDVCTNAKTAKYQSLQREGG